MRSAGVAKKKAYTSVLGTNRFTRQKRLQERALTNGESASTRLGELNYQRDRNAG